MNEDNMIFKTNEFSIEISPVGKAIQSKDIQYFSYDENSGLQLIHILMDGKPLDLPNGTEIRLSAVKLNNQSQKLIYTPEIVDPLNGIVSFVIPREFLGYRGQIRCGLYINFSNNQTMHVGYFYINMGVSDIDTNLTEFTEDFWQDWAKFEAGSTAKMQELEQRIDEQTEDFWQGWSEFEAGSTAKMQELEQRIDEQTEIFNNADVYNKAEIEDKLEPFALRTDIATLDERLDTKEQEVTAQLAHNEKRLTATPFSETETVFVAHRGLNKIAPENTIPAIDLAGQFGVKMVEVDVRLTSDGELVLMHDDTVDRMTNGTGLVSSKTLIEIKNLVIDATVGAVNFPETRVPTFEEYLLVCKKWNIKPFIHLYDEGGMYKVVDLLKKYNLEHKCILGVGLAKTKELRSSGNSSIKVVVGGRTADNVHEMDGIDNVIAGTMSVTPSQVVAIHNAGYALSDYNGGNSIKWRTANSEGIDYYLVDDVVDGGTL